MFETLDIAKATQAAGALLRAAEGSMSRQRLLKLLYLADRESLRTSGWPIIGHRIAAFDDGPAHAEVHSLLDGESADVATWGEYLRRQGYLVRLVAETNASRLSEHDVRTLHSVIEQYRNTDDWQLVELTRALPEWQANYQLQSHETIPYADIVAAVGFGAEDAAEILEHIDEAIAEERLHRELRSPVP